MELFEWAKHYIKFKDCMKKNIQDMKLNKDSIETKEKKEDKLYIIAEKAEEGITKLTQEKTIIIVCLNTKENIKTIHQHWKELIKYPQLTIICAQPVTNETWSLHPSTHHKIAENIKEGLQTLYESISSAD